MNVGRTVRQHMKRLNKHNINSPELFNDHFKGTFGLHDMERQRLLAKYFKGGVYVDVGCMDSPMPALLAETHDQIYALDFADKIIEFLAPRFPKVHYQVIKNELSLPFEDNSVDYLVAGEFIEHLESPAKFIEEAKRVVKEGGWIAISTPFEETISQNCIGGREHVWAFFRKDIESLLDNPEIELIKEADGRINTILAWKQL